jgi:hypothetical protein
LLIYSPGIVVTDLNTDSETEDGETGEQSRIIIPEITRRLLREAHDGPVPAGNGGSDSVALVLYKPVFPVDPSLQTPIEPPRQTTQALAQPESQIPPEDDDVMDVDE